LAATPEADDAALFDAGLGMSKVNGFVASVLLTSAGAEDSATFQRK
jgi:hypothetical protein